MTEETNPDILPSEETANTPAPEVNDEPIAAAAPEAPRAEENPAPAAAPATAPTAEPAAPLVAEPVPEPVAEPAAEEVAPGPVESFADVLKAFESTHTHRAASKQLEGTVVSLSAEQVILDVGYKMEGVLPRSSFPNNAEGVKAGDRFPVSITGRNEEGYYELSRFRVAQPRDWSALETAFADKAGGGRHRDRSGQGRPQRGCGRARVHACLAQRHARCSRTRSPGGPADSVPHHQARCDR